MLRAVTRRLALVVLALSTVAGGAAAEGRDQAATDIEQLIEQARRAPAPAMPSMDAIRAEALRQQRIAPDLVDLAGDGEALQDGDIIETDAAGPAVYVFISFSMPETTLKRLLAQAERIDAPLVLRGMVEDSMPMTMRALQRLVGTDKGKAAHKRIAIDPTLFERFGIERVPTFVVAEAPVPRCTGTACPVPQFYAVGGDVTLGWALEHIEGTAPPPMKAAMEPLLARAAGGE